MESDADEQTEEVKFDSNTEPLQPRITIVNLDVTAPVVEEPEVEGKAEDVVEVSDVAELGGGDDVGGMEEVDNNQGAEVVRAEETQVVEGNEESGEGSSVIHDVVEVAVDADLRGEEATTNDVSDDVDIATHIREWVNRAIDGAGVSEMESLEDHMRNLIMDALSSAREELSPDHDQQPEDEGSLGDHMRALIMSFVPGSPPKTPESQELGIRELLVNSLIELPGRETGIDESRWILHELRAWVNTAMGIKTFVTKQTSTSTIDKHHGRVDYDSDEEEKERVRQIAAVAAAAAAAATAATASDDDDEKLKVGRPTTSHERAQTSYQYSRRFHRSSPCFTTATSKDDVMTSSVSFHLNESQVYTHEFPISTKVSSIKETISGTLNVPIDVIGLLLEELPMLDTLSLKQLGILPFSSVDVKCFSMNPEQYPLLLISDQANVKHSKPEFRNVTVQVSEETIKQVVVEVTDESMVKPWVGGYRDKGTKIQYHHAFSQTQPRGKCMKAEGKTSRDTQTAEWRYNTQNTVCEKATQMWRRDYYIPADQDKILTPGVYVTYAEIEAARNVLQKVLTIQRYTRAWLLRRWVARMSREYRRLLALEEEAERRRLEEKLKRLKRRITRKTYPKSRGDFDMLYHMVEMWRLAEVARITRMRGEASKKTELYYLMQKEIVILSCIEKHRVRVKAEKQRKSELDFIDKSAEPITWTGYKGRKISMETGNSRNARELKQLYYSLGNHTTTPQERIDLLIQVKNALKPFNTCGRVLDLVELLERECDCLTRGLTHNELDMLRMRTRRMFSEFLKDPALNPDADKKNLPTNQGDLVFCELCRKLLPQYKFKLNTCAKVAKYCESCCWVANIARLRLDYGPYRRILNAVRKEEARRCCFSSVAFLMQDEDFYYLLFEIWKAHSAIDKCDDLDDLVFSRWRVDEDWSPWNCILLTYREARAHNRLRKSLEETYEEDFFEWVIVKHQEAKVHFRQLARVDTRFRESGRWFNADLTIKYTAGQ